MSIQLNLTEEEIKLAAIRFTRDIFDLNNNPKQVLISELNVFVEYCDDDGTEKGMEHHEKYNLVFSKNKNGEIATINIFDTEILIKYHRTQIEEIGKH